jgi:hypothetical protein
VEALSTLQRLSYGYVSRMNAFAYAAANRSLLGMRLSRWMMFGLTVLLLVGWVREWPVVALVSLLLVLLWLAFSFWRARRSNYIRFVASADALPSDDLTEGIVALAPNQRVPLEATGVFSVSSRDVAVLQQPGHYWQVPLGDHIVMVEDRPGKFAYQFFSAANLQGARHGWLLFGPRPLECLAVSFMSAWGPEYTKFQQYDDGKPSATPPKTRTIYLGFESGESLQAVWRNIVADVRRSRSAATANTD